jgi:glycosyltransferase involved in cell wall biosynthesis
MKQLWILNHYAQHIGGAGGTRHFHLAQRLKKYGWNASIVAASFDHSSGQQRFDLSKSCQHESIDGVPFVWLKTPPYSRNGFRRILNILAYSIGAVRKRVWCALPKPDVVIGSSVHPMAALSALIISIRLKVPFVFEVRDLWPQTLVDMGALRNNSLITYVLRRLEIELYKRSSLIIVLMPGAVDYIARLRVDSNRVICIPNGVDLSLFSVSGLHETKKADQFTLMYFGAHGRANDLANVVRAMYILQNEGYTERVLLRIIGDGPEKDSLISQSNALGIKNIRFEPPVKKSEIPTVAASADAFIFTLINCDVFRYGISPNKLFDFMAAGRPVIYCCSAANNPVAEAAAGITVPPSNPTELSNAIKRLIKMPKKKHLEMGRRARDYIKKHHDFVSLGGKLAVALDSLLKD